MSEWRAWKSKAMQEGRRLAGVEKHLDEKIARVRTWSGMWWHLLGQLNVVRGQLIYLSALVRDLNRQILEEEGSL